MHINIYININIHIQICMNIHMHRHIYMHIHIHIYINIYITQTSARGGHLERIGRQRVYGNKYLRPGTNLLLLSAIIFGE